MKKKTKQNCPVCRTDIKRVVQCKILDEYADKLYDQFVSEGGKLQRNSLKEEREKIKKEAEADDADFITRPDDDTDDVTDSSDTDDVSPSSSDTSSDSDSDI